MRSVEWIDDSLRFIDQTRLPLEEIYVNATDVGVVAEAIRSLRIRGAPAIGVAAAFGVVLGFDPARLKTRAECEHAVANTIAFLGSTRPTAVNLFTALRRMRAAFDRVTETAPVAVRESLLAEANAILREDIQACERMGKLGATLIDPGSTLLTHCNTGALATAGDGTALSVIIAAAREGKVVRVYADETRPLFQGSRLTAWELVKNRIPATVITDSTAGSLLRTKRIHAVLVGSDRIAANGDAANKIGTYPLAVLAAHHHVPFYVVAPTSTIDSATPSGDSIKIEERDSREVTHVAGTRIAAEGVEIYAPAFDVTPNELITALVTEKGIIRPPYREGIARVVGSLPTRP